MTHTIDNISKKIRIRTYHIDGDTLEASSHYDEGCSLWLEDYIDFDSAPRYTAQGRPWRSVTNTDCPYAPAEYHDCGTCRYLKKELPNDLIGVCYHPDLKEA